MVSCVFIRAKEAAKENLWVFIKKTSESKCLSLVLSHEEFHIQCLGINFSHQVCPSPLGWQISSQAAHWNWQDPPARSCPNNSKVKVFSCQVMSKQFQGEGFKEAAAGHRSNGFLLGHKYSPQFLCSPGQGYPGAVHPLVALLAALTPLVWMLGIL